MKKLLSVVLISLFLCSSASAVFPISDWAKLSVSEAERIQLINGNYNFQGDITREEFCELIYNYYALVSDEIKADETEISFTDTDNGHIAVLNSLGIITGKSETEFAPNDLLTREEAATIIFRLIKTAHPDFAATELWFEFADNNDVSDWAADSIQRLCNLGIMNGIGNNLFAPKKHFTTEQAVATLVRCYGNFNNSYENAENMTYSDMESLQAAVDNGHFPWRLDPRLVIAAHLSGKGENVENGELTAFSEDTENCGGDFKIGENTYRLKLFKPIDKSANGIWVVRTCEKTSAIDGGDTSTDISVDASEEFLKSKYIDIKTLPTLDIQVENPFKSDDRTLILNDSIDNEIELFVYDYYKNIMSGAYQEAKNVIADASLLAATENSENNFEQGIYYSQVSIKAIEPADKENIAEITKENQIKIANMLSDFQVEKFAIVRIEYNIKHNEKSLNMMPQVGDGDVTRYYLIGKSEGSYKIFEVYWEGFMNE